MQTYWRNIFNSSTFSRVCFLLGSFFYCTTIKNIQLFIIMFKPYIFFFVLLASFFFQQNMRELNNFEKLCSVLVVHMRVFHKTFFFVFLHTRSYTLCCGIACGAISFHMEIKNQKKNPPNINNMWN